MPRLTLVRHGEAAATWTEHADPGLSDAGRAQAAAAADALGATHPRPVFTSPLRRTRETARAFEELWGVEAAVEPGVAEVPTPASMGLDERGPWLREILSARWSEAPAEVVAWRAAVVETLAGIDGDAVVVTHFVPINVAVGAATGDDRVVTFRPDYCSRTVLDVDGAGHLHIVERGEERTTVVR